jgi:hypothetical protein
MNDQQTPKKLLNGLPSPPIPQRLRELLKDYPGHLARIQEVLDRVVVDHAKSVPLFEQAIWALEGRTDAFVREAQAELEAAQAAADVDTIARAEAKVSLMRRSSNPNVGLGNLDELWSYFKEHAEFFK